ncbi:MAG: hypothetical protein ABGW88_02630 [Leeuwenhoekiella sp.]|uniref:hypothetical protein n=1 Tax=Leeuwenhoekiella TaxID=283735 RepID=UPI000C553634|nr:hypothetical protein [Leeuwenhoekiella sp.]MAO44198.1 hypothetical protein [Leeuwenhoekiella sp.]|tara:strand:+ start:42598 stop:44751 length:2154 start_codon:yes stop_codon:yes gene_type:complete
MKNTFWITTIVLALCLIGCKKEQHTEETENTTIDRKAVVTRHNVHISEVDTLASLTVGNGAFAFTTDVTGLQSFPEYYQRGITLGTLSEWGWNAKPNNQDYSFEETLKDYDQNGRKVSYATQIKTPQHAKEAVEFFRSNPHRVHLGNLGFELTKKDGTPVKPEDLSDIDQTLDLWTGMLTSSFAVEGIPVQVKTASAPNSDVIAVQVNSALIASGQLKIRLRFAAPTAAWTDYGTQWENPEYYTSSIAAQDDTSAVIERQLDSLNYNVALNWEGTATVSEKEAHYFLVEPTGDQIALTCTFTDSEPKRKNATEAIFQNSATAWESYWSNGGIVDFSGSADPRANELERRVVLSQYLTKAQTAGKMPPQETGLTYNSWYGKPHLEMHWWHGVHYALWGRPQYLENTLNWYETAFDNAKALAERQGFKGARWQKMTDPYGEEGPSSVGAFLVWQQPHFITFAELLYRADTSEATLNKYKERVFATAEFMASFPDYDKENDRYVLGPPVIPAQERFEKTETFNPTYELAYWNWALKTASAWKERAGEPVPKQWTEVLEKLSALPVQEDYYLATESATDSYTNPEFLTDHPSVFGAYGMLPETSLLNKATMRNTFNKVWEVWTWEDTWGWDFPMTAMTATRLGMPEKAVDALFMDAQTNTYLKNGHNYQEERLTLYMPGNGGLLTAVAMMCAGWDGNETKNPGFPKDGSWNVKWEGLEPFF